MELFFDLLKSFSVIEMDQKSFLANYSWDQLKSNIKSGLISKWINEWHEFMF